MHPEDIPRRPVPQVLRRLVDEEILSQASLAPLLERVPLAERAISMLGSAEGFDSSRWSVERDAALAELAARRLPAGALVEDAGLELDLSAARRTATEGLCAHHMHRALRPAAEGVGRLLAAAYWRGALGAEEILAEAMALTTLAPSGLPPNEAHAETRGSPRDRAGGEPHRIWPDVALVVTGVADHGRRIDILLEFERTIAWAGCSVEEVLEEAFARCQRVLPPEGEVAVLWIALPKAYWATSGPRCQMLRARRGELVWLRPRRESAPVFEIHTIDACEGDTFLLLDDEAWAETVSNASARRPEPRPAAATLRDELRRRFVERLAVATAAPADLSPRGLAMAKLGQLADLLFAELGQPREATVAILRVPPWSPPADLSARLSRELRAFAERKGVTIELRSARIDFHGDGHPPPGRTRHLALVLGCDARIGRADAEALADTFVTELRARHPWLCSSHHVVVEPLRRGADPSLSVRLATVHALPEDVLRGRVGLEARVTARESWGASTRIEVLILRNDVDGAEDESAAASALRRALRRAGRTLAETVDVRADYVK